MNTLDKFPTCTVIFSGGEPTYHPDFEKILQRKPAHIRAGVISNAARPLAFWERIVSGLSFVILTYHADYANLERFLGVALLLYKQHSRPGCVNLIMVPDKWDYCINVYNTLRENGIHVRAKPLVEDFGLASSTLISAYTPDQLAWISNVSEETLPGSLHTVVYNRADQQMFVTNPAELLSQHQTNFKGWSCELPAEFMAVDFSGDIYNTSCPQRVHIGHINTGFTPNLSPILCEQDFCWNANGICGNKKSPNYLRKS
jgi:hypothetical protein